MHSILTKNQIALIFSIATLAVIIFQPELTPLLLALFAANKPLPNMRREGARQIAETQLMFPCQQTFFNQKKPEWKVAPDTIPLHSLTEERACSDFHHNHWGDVLSQINERFKPAIHFRSRWQRFANYFDLDIDEQNTIEKHVMEKLIASSNTASDKYTKAGLTPKQTGQNAIKQYQLAFNQIKTWAKEKHEFTIERILELHTILIADISDSGVFRKENGGLPRVHFADHKMIPDVINNLVAYLNHPPATTPPLVVALTAQQIILALHPMVEANGRLSQLMTNWYLMSQNLPPIALPYSLMRHLSVFSYITEEGSHHFREIAEGKDPYHVTLVTLSPAIFADIYHDFGIPTTWGEGTEGQQKHLSHVNAQQDLGKHLLETATSCIEKSYQLVSNQENKSFKMR